MQERKPQPGRISELLRAGAERLTAAGIDTAQLESELIWAHVLGTTQLRLHTDPGMVPEVSDRERAEALLARRCQREPLQHILAEEHFYGRSFLVNPHVLIPRPETELLVEQAIEFLRAFSSPQVLDFGTGSGCISITLAKEVPDARIVTVDISREATVVARENAAKHGCAEGVVFLNGDGFAPLETGQSFDLVVSNPPYIPSTELESLQPEVRDYDPRLALDGGIDGLDFYRRLASGAKHWLKSGGKIMVELGHDQAPVVRELFESEMWIVDRVVDDYSRIPRILIAHPVGSADCDG